MTIFCYDNTFEGLLTCVFDAYLYKTFPDALVAEGEPMPMFHDKVFTIVTDGVKSDRVWKAIGKKLSGEAQEELVTCWMADSYPKIDELMFRYIRKVVDSAVSIEINFGDLDVLELSRVFKQVRYERIRLMQFARFQKTADGIYFAPFEPVHNILPIAVEHFKDRFADQKWLIYDVGRDYGFYYDLHSVERVCFGEEDFKSEHEVATGNVNKSLRQQLMSTGSLDDSMLAEDEKLLQLFTPVSVSLSAISSNPRKHRQDMPVRYWKYLTEKH